MKPINLITYNYVICFFFKNMTFSLEMSKVMLKCYICFLEVGDRSQVETTHSPLSVLPHSEGVESEVLTSRFRFSNTRRKTSVKEIAESFREALLNLSCGTVTDFRNSTP